ncbi:MAG: LysR family transcriptional regulator [Phyllobacteriaceae bacterium]|nr:LysR family transcriptional regulator [Phyllobacteriaceae bacterium]
MIDKLEMFIALAREQHFGRAAEACNISQPSLSAAIKQLEDQLGVQLVNRGSRYLGLTADGERALVWARRIVADSRAMKAEIQTTKHGLSGRLRIAVIPTATPMVHELTGPFSAQHPDVTFTVVARTSEQALALLEGLEADVAITYLDNEPLGNVTSLALYSERHRFLTADPSLFAGRATLTWAEAASAPLCLLTPDMQNRRIINQHFARAGVSANVALESDSVFALYSHVLSGKWAAIMGEKPAEMFSQSGLMRAIPLVEPEIPFTVGLVVLPREPHTALIDAFLRQARAYARKASV